MTDTQRLMAATYEAVHALRFLHFGGTVSKADAKRIADALQAAASDVDPHGFTAVMIAANEKHYGGMDSVREPLGADEYCEARR